MTHTIAPQEFRELAARIMDEVSHVIVGQVSVVRYSLIALLADGHLLLEGVPGLGKTMLVRTLGAALQLDFKRVQFTPDLMPADIIGTDMLEITDTGNRRFRFHQGPVFTGLLLADEINRATPKTQSALLEAMQEHQVTVGGTTYPLPRPFLVLATQNPIELEGTYPLPEAQLDRFLFKINISYPSSGDLVEILNRTTGVETPSVTPVADQADILGMQTLVRSVPVATPVRQYAANLTVATHPDAPAAPEIVKKAVRYGASPRGAQALMLGAKTLALLNGRYNAAISDIREVAFAALRHRLILNYEAQAEGITADRIIEEVLAEVPV
ncbi:MAG: MoxR family ATPase [Anaerolineales bacterium]|nr:MAG: MoxR family ATPase [Anaerolineales bacterium]